MIAMPDRSSQILLLSGFIDNLLMFHRYLDVVKTAWHCCYSWRNIDCCLGQTGIRKVGSLIGIDLENCLHRFAVSSVKQTPTWLTLIFLFFSPRMLALWRRVTAGIFIGLLADQLTETNNWPLWWGALL